MAKVSAWTASVEAKKPSLILNLGTNGLKVTSEPPQMAGKAGCLQGQDRLAVTHPSSSHARRCLIWLSCDNRCTRYTVLTVEVLKKTLKTVGLQTVKLGTFDPIITFNDRNKGELEVLKVLSESWQKLCKSSYCEINRDRTLKSDIACKEKTKEKNYDDQVKALGC
ncbi:hypothetical protein J6590_055478 [Homalodisca vitripennis]|nr:hypothetical protein J6590_055478 [Homalodisca vitripennis]